MHASVDDVGCMCSRHSGHRELRNLGALLVGDSSEPSPIKGIDRVQMMMVVVLGQLDRPFPFRCCDVDTSRVDR